MLARFFICLAAAAALSACVTADVAIAPVAPKPLSITGETLKVKSGELILRQQAVVLQAVKLEQAVSVSAMGDLFATKEELPAGALMYRVGLMTDRAQLIYCVFDTISNAINPDVRICLADEDKDGRFDRKWEMSEPYRAVSVGGGDVIAASKPLATPVPYTEVDVSTTPAMTLGIVYRCPLLGTQCWFNIVDVHDAQLRDLGFVQFQIPKTEVRPVFVNVLGARVEVVSNSMEALEYRMLQPFPADKSIGIIRYTPKTTYIYY